MDNRERRILGIAGCSLWILLSLAVLTFRRFPAFEMDILYVGQGDGIFITCEGRHFLVDGGSSSKDDVAGDILLPFLHIKGVGHLDGIIVTHEDGDHCSGVLEFLENAAAGRPDLSVGSVYLPEIGESAKGDKYHRIESLAADAGIPVRYISRGQRLRTGNLSLECLHPERGAEYPDSNEASLTLLLRYGDSVAPLSSTAEQAADSVKNSMQTGEEGTTAFLTGGMNGRTGTGESGFTALLTGDPEGQTGTGESGFTALLTGDLEGQGEADFLTYLKQRFPESEGRIQVDLLKVPHHGSRSAASEMFLDSVKAGNAVISAGIGNLYGHPHRELLQRLEAAGITYERTDLSGMITIREQGRRMCHRDSPCDTKYIFIY